MRTKKGMTGFVATACVCSCSCPKEFRGIHDGDTIQTTIVSNDSLGAFGNAAVTCGTLNDLPMGAVLTSKASVSAPSGSEGCFNELTLAPRTITTGTFTTTPVGSTQLQLPNGCTGLFVVYFQSPNESSFLDDGVTDAGVAWWLIRRFEVTGSPGPCFGDASAPGVCIDAFIAKNVRQ